ncbi:hypothetical protein CABS01_01111, partial [Colletotrichum abscissum]|uniref:uncharacterized protein n=1 Tax=Colletotrichum abscissum TaxID=1671311 RepID=UPI0027D6CB81
PTSELDSYVFALEAKLQVFSESLHVIRHFRHLVDLIDLIQQNRNQPREEIGQYARILCNRWFTDPLELDVPVFTIPSTSPLMSGYYVATTQLA